MDGASKICKRYAAILGSIALLDRAYYRNEAPTRWDRVAYVVRQQRLQAIRIRFYSELAAIRGRAVGPVN